MDPETKALMFGGGGMLLVFLALFIIWANRATSIITGTEEQEAAMAHGGDIVGMPVSDAEVASGLGFKSVADFRAWKTAGSPTGRCSNGHCWRPAFWPDLEKPCRYCGSVVRIDKPGEPNL